MADISNFGVGLSIDIKGAMEATRQAERLGAAIDKVYEKTDKPIDFTVKTKSLDWDALFKKGEDKLNALKDAIRNLGRDARPPANLRETLSELFPEDKAETFFTKVQREYRDTGKLGGQIAASIQKAYQQMFSAMSAAQTAWADKTKDPSLRNNLINVAKDAEKAFSQLASNAIADLSKLEKSGMSVGNKIRAQLTLLRDNKINPDKAYDSLEKSLLGMGSARYAASRTGAERIDAINAQKLAEQTAELEKQAALKAQMAEMDRIAAATLESAAQAAQQVSAKEQLVKEQTEQIAVEMSRIGRLADTLTGSFQGMASTGVGALRSSLKGTQETLRELATDAKTFRDLFGDETAKRVQKVREAAMRSQVATLNLKSTMLDENGVPTKSTVDEEVLAATRQVNLANQQLLTAQKELSNNLLKTITESHDKLQSMVGIGKRLIEEEARATQYEVQRKEAIASVLSSMEGGRSVVENQRRLQQQIVDIVRENGNMESEVLNKKLSELNIDKQRLEYAQRLLQASRELATGKQANNTRYAQYSLASESYGAARDSAMTANTKTTMREALKSMTAAGEVMARMGAQDTFRDTISQVIASINTGLVPSYDKIISAAQRFSSVNKTAFADDKANIEMLGRAVTALQKQYSSMRQQDSGMGQRTKIIETMKILGSISSQGASQQSQDLADRINRAVREQERFLQRDKELAAAQKSITEQVDKLVLLQQMGVNTVGNERKLLDAALEARRKNVDIENVLFSRLHDKKQLLRNIHNEIVTTDAVTKNMNFSAQSELMLLQRKRDLYIAMRSAMTAANTTVSTVDVAPNVSEKINKNAVEGKIQSLTREIAAQEKQLANAQAFERQQNEIAKQLASRAASEQKIVDIANRAVAAVADQKLQYDQLYQTARAYVTAVANGQNISGTRLDMVKAEESALQSLLNSEQNLLGVMNNEKEAITARLVAAQKLQEVEQNIAQILASGRTYQMRVGDKQRTVASGYGEETHAQATDFITNNTAKLQREAQNAKQEFLTIKQAIEMADEALKNGGAVMRMRNQLENDYAVKIKQSLEYILAGIDPFKNYVSLQNQINAAAAAGLQIDKESLAVAQRKKEILAAVANQVKQSLINGLNSQDPMQAAVIAKSARPRIDMLRDSGYDTTKLEAALGKVEEKAGAQLASSFAAAKKHVGDTYAAVQKMFSGLTYVQKATESTSTAYHTNLAVINRIVDAINKVKQAEQGVLSNADAINKMSSEELINQQRRVTMAEQLVAALKRVGSAQNSMNENLAKTGKGYAFEDVLTAQGVKNIGDDAKNTKTSQYYVKAAEAAKTMQASVADATRIINEMSNASPAAAASLSKIQAAMQQLSGVANTATTQMNKITEIQKRLSQNDAGANIFDRFRIYWFMQLRAFWEMYTNLGQLISTITQYNQTLKTMQAVTQGTTRDVGAMATEFSRLTSEVPLALAAVSKAALDVAKAGFGVQDTLKIVQSASKLAVATQSDIATVADLQSVIVHAWHYSVDDIDKISNQLFNAVSKSRADINGLASAIGYISGIAPQANVPLDEALSVMSILTNAGFTMSKAGTYTRQFLNDLMNPSAKLQNVIASLGLSLSDIDPRLNSLENIFRTLGASGMNVADAFEGMSIRAASAFSVMLKNSKYIQQFTDSINEAGAVDTAFETASDTTAASFQLLVNAIINLGQVLAELTGGTVKDFLDMLTTGVNKVTEFFEVLNRNPTIKSFTSAALTLGALVLSLKGVIALLSKFVGFAGGIGAVAAMFRTTAASATAATAATATAAASVATVGTAATVANTASRRLMTSLLGFASAHPIFTALSIATIAFATVLEKTRSKSAELAEQMDKLKRATEDFSEATKKTFQLQVDYTEAAGIGGALTLADRDIEENKEVNSPRQKRAVRTTMQTVASLLRGSEDANMQKEGERINRILPSVDASAEEFQKSMLEYERILNRVRGIINETQREFADGVRKIGTTIKDAGSEFSVAATALEAGINRAAASRKKISPELYGGASTQEDSKGLLTLLPWFDDDATTAARAELATLHNEILGMQKGVSAAGSAGSRVFGWLGSVTEEAKEFSKWTSLLTSGLKSIGMALTAEEEEWLRNTKTAKEYSEVVAKILHERDIMLATGFRSGFDENEYKDIEKNIKTVSSSLSTALKNIAVTPEQLNTTISMANTMERLIAAARKHGLDKDPALAALIKQWEPLPTLVNQYREAANAAIAETEALLNDDPGKITKEIQDQWDKTKADRFKNAVKEVTAAAGSTAKVDLFSQMFNLGDSEGALRERIDATFRRTADLVADAQAGGPGLLKTVGAEEMSNLNNALKELFKNAMQAGPGADALEKFLNAYSKMTEKMRERGVTTTPDMQAMAKIVGLSKELSEQFSLQSQQNPFATMTENMTNLGKATEMIAQASQKGLMENKDMIGVFKTFMSAQKNLQSVQSDLAKTLTTTSRSLANYKIAAAGLQDLSFKPDDINATAVAMENAAAAAEEMSARLEAVEDATVDVNNILKAYRQQMTALKEMPDSLMSIQTMETTADGLRKNLDLVRQQAKALKDALASAKKEMLSIKLAAANSQLDFARSYNDAKRQQEWRPDNSFRTAQENMNLQREYIAKNMPYMDVGEAISALTDLRNQMIEFGKTFPGQERARAVLDESMDVQGIIQGLYQAQFEQKKAEAQVNIAWQGELLDVGHEMSSYLKNILEELQRQRGNMSEIPYQTLPSMKPGEPPARYQVGTDVGALSRKYESAGKDSMAIGYDDKGGTSYGTYQIASKVGTFDNFLKFLERFDNDLFQDLTSVARLETTKKTGDANAPVKWNAGNRNPREPGAIAWQQATLNNPERMRKAEEAFIADTHFAPALETYMKASGATLQDISLAVQQALYSTGVQHGASGQRSIVESAVGGARGADGKVDEAQFLKNLYAGRANKMPSTASRYKEELEDALRMLKSGATASTQPAGTGKNPEPVQQQALDLTTAAVKEAEAMEAAARELAALQEQYKNILEGGATEPVTTTGPNMTAAVSPVVYSEENIAEMAKNVEEATKKYFTAVAAYMQKLTSSVQKQQQTTLTAPAATEATAKQTATQATTQTTVATTAGTAATRAATVSTTQFNQAVAEYNKSTTALTANMEDARRATGGLRDVQHSKDAKLTGPYGVADQYLIDSGWEGNAMQYSKELFTAEVNTMKSGLANIFTTSVRDAINNREDWQEAAWDMIYNMIDAWVNQMMSNLVNSLIQSTMANTAKNTWGWLGFGLEGASAGGATGAVGAAHTGGLVGSGVVYRHLGGVIPAFAAGGMVTQGNRQADSTMAMLTKGEFVVQEPTVRKYGVEFMRTLNEGNIGEVQQALGDFGVTQNYKSQSFTGADAQGRTNASGNGGQTAAGGRRDKQQMNIVNVSDPQDVGRFLATSRGERMVLNIMNKSSRRSRGNY